MVEGRCIRDFTSPAFVSGIDKSHVISLELGGLKPGASQTYSRSNNYHTGQPESKSI
jgi:hypothetical protein